MAIEIQLPEQPVDNFEIKFWRVEGETLKLYRYVFHVDKAWKDLYPDDDSKRGGAPWLNEWQCFEGDSCTGRLRGWRRMIENLAVSSGFADRGDALRAFIESLNWQRKRLLDRMVELNRLAVEADEELASGD